MDETKLQMVRRHVRQGEALVRRQREIVAHIIDIGADARKAKEILAVLEDSQAHHVAHLARIND